ncbi:uncharacterized protein BXZ73DRAFT_107885 [Epithele typhae]|uniref:uncharacterized protein n=1 Tax=Epithele typhae TaxID=378194 RepID=UPI002008006A|nr:uncharacterized protein BXZ73DRAFT_107885 [Epithele typhae]KAH9911616.1 hypothetical protein BXZ73DRAFT_107885 [Epithele typhae]
MSPEAPLLPRIYTNNNGAQLSQEYVVFNDIPAKNRSDALVKWCEDGKDDRLPFPGSVIGRACPGCSKTITRAPLSYISHMRGAAGAWYCICPFKCRKVWFPPQPGPTEGHLRLIEAQRFYDMARLKKPIDYDDTPEVVEMLQSLQREIGPAESTTAAEPAVLKSKGKSKATPEAEVLGDPSARRTKAKAETTCSVVIWNQEDCPPRSFPMAAPSGKLSLSKHPDYKRMVNPEHRYEIFEFTEQAWNIFPKGTASIPSKASGNVLLRRRDVLRCTDFGTYFTRWEAQSGLRGDDELIQTLFVDHHNNAHVALVWDKEDANPSVYFLPADEEVLQTNVLQLRHARLWDSSGTAWRRLHPMEDATYWLRSADHRVMLFKIVDGNLPGLGTALHGLDVEAAANHSRRIKEHKAKQSSATAQASFALGYTLGSQGASASSQGVRMEGNLHDLTGEVTTTVKALSSRMANTTPSAVRSDREAGPSSGIVPTYARSSDASLSYSARALLEDDVIELSD